MPISRCEVRPKGKAQLTRYLRDVSICADIKKRNETWHLLHALDSKDYQWIDSKQPTLDCWTNGQWAKWIISSMAGNKV